MSQLNFKFRSKILSEYNQEIPQSQTTDKPKHKFKYFVFIQCMYLVYISLLFQLNEPYSRADTCTLGINSYIASHSSKKTYNMCWQILFGQLRRFK